MQQELKWCYYNHAIVPTTAPHERVDESILESRSFWKSVGGRPFFARWTTDFDCQEDTGWWYEIKDTPFDIMSIPSKYRYYIKKGLKHFEVRVIESTNYAEELYQVQEDAYATYPSKYRPTVDYDQFTESLNDRRKGITFAAFSKEDGSMAGYTYLIPYDGYVLGSMLKAKPSQEKKQVNAALVYSVLDHFRKELEEGAYITYGERSIIHETNFQEYLERYFQFRKAYCRMHIRYRPGFKQTVICLYPIRGLLKHLDGINLFYKLNSVLKMEEIARISAKSYAVKEAR